MKKHERKRPYQRQTHQNRKFPFRFTWKVDDLREEKKVLGSCDVSNSGMNSFNPKTEISLLLALLKVWENKENTRFHETTFFWGGGNSVEDVRQNLEKTLRKRKIKVWLRLPPPFNSSLFTTPI